MQEASLMVSKDHVSTPSIHIENKYNTASLLSDPQSMTLKYVDEYTGEEKVQHAVTSKIKMAAEDHKATAETTKIAVIVPVVSARGPRAWNELFRQLKIYRSINGHCKVPQHHIQDGLKLGKWVSNQRQQLIKRQRGEYTFLTEERIKSLDDISFNWQLDRNGCTWKESVAHLSRFKAVHGHTNVPYHYDKRSAHSIKLGIWVRRQREEMSKLLRNKRSTLTPRRIDDLNALGFVWKLGKSPKPKRKENLLSDGSDLFIATNNESETQGLTPRHAAAAGGTTKINNFESTQQVSRNETSLKQPNVRDSSERYFYLQAPQPEIAHSQSYQSPSSSFWCDHQRLHQSEGLLAGDRLRHSESLKENSSCNLLNHPFFSSGLDSLVSENTFSSPRAPSLNPLELGPMGSTTHLSSLLHYLPFQPFCLHEDACAACAVDRMQLCLENVRNQILERNLQLVIAQNWLQERQDALLLSNRLDGPLRCGRRASSSTNLFYDATLHRSVGELFPWRRAAFPSKEFAALLHPLLGVCPIPGVFFSTLDAVSDRTNSTL